jgi:tRNA (mo5U34)-methyltransferase
VNERVAAHGWWQTIELAPGVVTPGGWDLRPTAERMPWPGSLEGMRCLDVGTWDGFWAFELERRGAAEVVGIDLPGPSSWGTPRGETFRLAAELRGSSAQFLPLDLYDLDPGEHGEFDLVFVGYVLQLLRDPLGALEALRRVCRGSLIVLDTVSLPLSLLPAPLARLGARRGRTEFFVFNRRGLARTVELSGLKVEARTGVIRDSAGPGHDPATMPLRDRASHALGILGRSAAVRASA